MTRHDVTGATSSVTSSIKCNIAGSINPLGRSVKISYAEKFNDTTANRHTYAYPTILTNPLNNSSSVSYRFDTGANVWAKSPDSNSTVQGKVTARTFDSIGRLQKESVFKGNQAYLNNQEYAYTRYEYPTNQIQSKVYITVIDTDNDGADANDEVLAESWSDGAGRFLKSRTEHLGSSGGYTSVFAEYDILGQVKRSTVPTEINTNWIPSDAAARGWLWKPQEYDWKGRMTQTDSNGFKRNGR